MEEKNVASESIPKENHEIATNNSSNGDHGWQKVTAKRQRKAKPSPPAAANGGESLANGNSKIANGGDNVFRSLEQQSEDRRRRIIEAQREANGVSNGRSKVRSDDDDESDSDGDEIAAANGKADLAAAKKPKVKKPKKLKVTVSEASAKIDANELSAFLAEISESYESSQQELRLMRFADYFGRAFTAVSSAQFPWMKLFRESTVAKMVDIPLSNISEDVYKTSIDWINQHSVEALGSFVLWSLESLLAEFATHHTSAKSSKKVVQHVSSKSQVAIFVVIAMVLRRKPDALIHVLPKLSEDSKYQGQDKIPLLVWITLQASQGDLAVGLYAWARNLLPLVGGRTSNPQTRDLVLQLVERILSTPKARTILVNGAVRKGERLIPPSSFDILMRVTFPSSSARVKATERFEAIYPTLKEVSLAGSRGSKAMKQVSQLILTYAVKDAGESNRTPELAREAAGVFIWCLTQNADNFKQWDKLYEDHIEASVAILKKLSEQWKDISVKLTPLDPVREVLKSFRNKNEKAMGDKHALFKEADKYCKFLLGKFSRGNGCLKSMAFLVGIGALVAGASVLAPNLESFDWKKISEAFSSAL